MQPTPQQFLEFARANYPDIYESVEAEYMRSPANLGADEPVVGHDWGAITQQTAAFLSDLATRILQFQRQRDLQRINADRARQGLGPLDENFQPVQGAIANALDNVTGGGSISPAFIAGAIGLAALAYVLGSKK